MIIEISISNFDLFHNTFTKRVLEMGSSKVHYEPASNIENMIACSSQKIKKYAFVGTAWNNIKVASSGQLTVFLSFLCVNSKLKW